MSFGRLPVAWTGSQKPRQASMHLMVPLDSWSLKYSVFPELSTSTVPTPLMSLVLTTAEPAAPDPEPLEALVPLSFEPQAASITASAAAPAGAAHRASFDEFLMPPLRGAESDGSVLNYSAR